MAEPTLTRSGLRQLLARRLGLAFARRYNDSAALTGVTSTTIVTATGLTQATDFWNDSFFFHQTSGEVRRIVDFASGGQLTLEHPLSTLPLVADEFEIHTGWTADDLHDAINAGILASQRAFHDVVLDESLVLKENTLEYDLTSLTTLRYVLKLFRETAVGVLRGTATAGAAGSITDSALIGSLGSVTSSWKVSIYAGTGAGQLRSVSSANNGTGAVSVSSNWTTTPDTTSKYALWNPTVQYDEWPRILAARFDAIEFPSKAYLMVNYTESYGLRLRLQYLARPATLASEAGTTFVPQEFLINYALAELYSLRLSDSRVDRQRYAAKADHHRKLASDYLAANNWRAPAATLWQEADHGYRYQADSANPMGW